MLGENRGRALLFKNLATLRTDAPLFADVDELEWKGPTPAFAEWPAKMEDKRIEERVAKARRRTSGDAPADESQSSLSI